MNPKKLSSIQGLRLVNKHEAAAILGISPETLKKYRLREDSPLIRGIHYQVYNSRVIRYNPFLLADWALNRDNPAAHQKTIEEYLASLSPNQPKKRGRRAN
jgi:hypothetical protein